MGRDHHHPPIAVIRMFERPKYRFAEQSAETPAQTQLAFGQNLRLAAEVEVTQTIHTTLKDLPVRTVATRQFHYRVEKAPQPGAFDP
ncbi:hypothetical protein D3C84_514690 [compost metagenome]